MVKPIEMDEKVIRDKKPKRISSNTSMKDTFPYLIR